LYNKPENLHLYLHFNSLTSIQVFLALYSQYVYYGILQIFDTTLVLSKTTFFEKKKKKKLKVKTVIKTT
jgi:hypothetical protein